jgi:hypothetical protein
MTEILHISDCHPAHISFRNVYQTSLDCKLCVQCSVHKHAFSVKYVLDVEIQIYVAVLLFSVISCTRRFETSTCML